MQRFFSGVLRGVALATLLMALVAPAVRGDDDPIPADPGARIKPPTGAASQARINPPIGDTLEARVRPPGGRISHARIKPPTGVTSQPEPDFFDTFVAWLRLYAGI